MILIISRSGYVLKGRVENGKVLMSPDYCLFLQSYKGDTSRPRPQDGKYMFSVKWLAQLKISKMVGEGP